MIAPIGCPSLLFPLKKNAKLVVRATLYQLKTFHINPPHNYFNYVAWSAHSQWLSHATIKTIPEANDKWAKQTAVFHLVSEHNSVLQTSLEASNIFLNPWPSEERWGQGRVGSEQGMGKNPEWNLGCLDKLLIMRKESN